MPAVFISYSRKDFYFAESLAFHLDREGIATWLDANHLVPGGDWAAGIDHALDEAETVVLVLTPEASAPNTFVANGSAHWRRRSPDSCALPFLRAAAGTATRAKGRL